MCPSTINLHNFWQEFLFLINVLYWSIGYEKITKRGGQRKKYLGTSTRAKILLKQNSSNVFCEMISLSHLRVTSKKLSRFCYFKFSNAVNHILLNVLLLLGYANLSSKKNLLYYHFQIFCMEKLSHYTNNIYVSRLRHPI